MRTLLQEYVTHPQKDGTPAPPLAAYARRLLAAFGSPLNAGAPELIEPLSVRELQVLKLIIGGSSNQEIANTLVIALPTVKRHISTIYDKLVCQEPDAGGCSSKRVGTLQSRFTTP